jgi:hypothetical protein
VPPLPIAKLVAEASPRWRRFPPSGAYRLSVVVAVNVALVLMGLFAVELLLGDWFAS